MDNKAIANRVRALLAKTTENGATEAEAMMAAEKARELMDKYQIELGSIGMEAEGTAEASSPDTAYKTLSIKSRIASRIAAYCDVKVWRSKGEIIFFGLQSDAEFATWLIDSLHAFIGRSATEYMHHVPAGALNKAFRMPRWEAEKAFVLGAVHRINERLRDLADVRRREMSVTGSKSLVVVKSALVNRAFRELGLKLRSGSGSKTTAHDRSSYGAGRAAGDRASFGRPVGGSGGGQRLIAR